ncbi:hypothetical protein O181_070351 [Austropuccinia psidii MF-1]|uniref:DUF4939 domain-containing protein n=1 Tax=Austropuccinia psidii MF-1 TaxID=1389203 RepID=A0A9Q3I5L0_9BASI|nr:hypothetical protein [Austropuccinia psidii MF-1]
MQHMTQLMVNIQEASRQPSFNNSSTEAPECFYGTKPFKVRSLIQSYLLIVHNYQENLFEDKRKALSDTSFLIGRAEKWIEPNCSNLINPEQSLLPNN